MPRVLRKVGASFVVARRIVAIFMLSTVLVAGSVASGQTPPAPTPDPSDAFFNPDKLHELRLFIKDTDWALLGQNFRDNTYYMTEFTWNGESIEDVGIRSRGNGSRSSNKPGLRIDFNRYREQMFRGMKAFVLDNLVQDQSMIRERVSMATFARLGLPTPRETHAKLYVNDHYIGMYAIVEEVNKDFLKRVFGGTVGNIENDGYLYEYKWVYHYYFDYLGEELEPYQTILEAKTHENAPIAELYDRVHEVVREINEATEGNYVHRLSPYFDLNLLMKHLALENFLADFDGILGDFGMNNFYLYQFENQKRWIPIVWDKDNTVASPTDTQPNRAMEYDIFKNFHQNALVRRGINVPEIREMYLNAMLEIADSVSQQLPIEESPDDRRGWLEREIAKEYHQIKDGVYADTQKNVYYTNEDFERSVQYLTAFARDRAAFVRDAVARARAESAATLRRR